MLSPFKLRCLNGPLTGRDVTLPFGSLKLSGVDADLILAFTEAIELSLLVEDEKVRAVGEGTLWIEGVPRSDHSQPLPLETAIDLGGQIFVLGKVETIWGQFSLPERQVARKRAVRSSRFSLLAGLLLLSGALMTINGFGNTQTRNKNTAHATEYTPQWFAEQSRQLDLPDVNFTYESNQRLILSGYCHKIEKLKSLYILLAESGFFYRNQIICHDALLENSQRTLEGYGFRDIELTLDLKAGKLHVDGDVVAGPQWEAAYTALLNLRGIVKVTVSNRQREMFNRLIALLKASVGLDGLSISKEGNLLLVSGEIEASRRERISTVLKLFNQEAGRIQADFQNIPPSFSPEMIFPAPVVTYIGTGSNPNIQLANGLRLYSGSVLSNNYILSEFYSTGISVRRDMDIIFISNLF